MSVKTVANYPQYADVDIKYIPELFATKALVKYYHKGCLPAISNTDYEGEIKKFGDSVTVRTTPDISINEYHKGKVLKAEVPHSEPVELAIDKAKDYCFEINAIDEKQADIVLAPNFTSDAGEQMRIAIETGILGDIYADAAATNSGSTAGKVSANINLGVAGTPLAVNKANALKVLIQIGQVFDECSIPEEDRAIIIPSWFRTKLMFSELANVYTTGDTTSPLRNGRVGKIDRLTVYVSNLLSKVADSGGQTCTHIIACHKAALTFAAQLVENDSCKRELGFARLYKGLYVYGYQVMKPEGLVHLYAYKTADT